MNDLQNFTRRKDYLICVDSDGCAINSMDVKHMSCFGPCIIEEWGLWQWKEEILGRWNEINLYSMTRGINRFKGLAMMLREIDEHIIEVEGVEELVVWTDKARELSNYELERAVRSAQGPSLAKALSWSKAVNAKITQLDAAEKKAFAGVREALASAKLIADIVVVSSANREAVEEEWLYNQLQEFVDLLCCQDVGSKSYIISALKQKGYQPDKIIMVGDAPGDYFAAEENAVMFYPIIVREEVKSWVDLKEKGLGALLTGTFKAYGKDRTEKFLSTLRES